MLLGLVGKPSAGKSTFFKAATMADVAIASYPFTTIKPNHGVGYVKVECIDKELGVQCNPNHGFCIEGKRFVPEYCRIMRVQRDIPTYVTTAGVDKTNLRQYMNRRKGSTKT